MLSRCDQILTTRTPPIVEVGSSHARLRAILGDAESVYVKLTSINEVVQQTPATPGSTGFGHQHQVANYFSASQAQLYDAQVRLEKIRKGCGAVPSAALSAATSSVSFRLN